MELDRQVQVDLAESALAKLNDPTETKTVRRRHRLIYQESQKRLKELDVRLSLLRQAYVRRVNRRSQPSTYEPSSHTSAELTQLQTNSKHRTKKPRPPLDSIGTYRT